MTSPAAPVATRWSQVALIVFVGALAACQIGKVAPALPVMRADLGMDMVGAGWMASVYTGTAMVVGLLGGMLADRYGHRNTLVAGLLLIALGSTAGSQMDSLAPLIVSRIVEGLGFVLIVVSAPALVFGVVAPKDRGLAMGAWGLFMPLGLTVMLLLAPVILAAYDWRALWLFNAGLAVVAALLLVLSGIGGARKPVDPAKLWRDLAITVKTPAPWVLSIAFGIFSVQFSAINAWLPTYLIETQGRSTAAAGAMAAFIAIIYAPGAVLGGWLVGRGVARWLVIAAACGLMGLAGLIAFGLGLGPTASFGGIMLFSIVAGLVPTAILAAGPVMAPSIAQVGAFNGILIHGANGGTLVGPPAFAAVVSHFGGWSGGGIYLLIVGAAGIATAVFIGRLERRITRQKG